MVTASTWLAAPFLLTIAIFLSDSAFISFRPKHKPISNAPFKEQSSVCVPPNNHVLNPAPSDLPTPLLRYVQLHARARSQLTKPQNGSFPGAGGPNVLVWRCRKWCQGLGDRMRGIRVAFFLALLSDRVLIIDAPTRPFALEAALAPAMLNWVPPPWLRKSLRRATAARNSPKSVPVPHTVFVDWPCRTPPQNAPLPGRGNRTVDIADPALVTRLAALPRFVVLRTDALDTFTKYLLENPAFPPALQAQPAHSSAPLVRAVMAVLFKPSAPVRSRVAARRPRGAYTGVHVRAGTGVGEGATARFRALQSARAVAGVGREAARCALRAGAGAVVIVSDSRAHARAVAREVGGLGMQAWLGEGGRLHLSKLQTWPGSTSARDRRPAQRSANAVRAACTAYLDLFADVWLLAEADTLIVSKSGFSKVGMLFGSTKRVLMFDVRRPEGARCVEDNFATQWWW